MSYRLRENFHSELCIDWDSMSKVYNTEGFSYIISAGGMLKDRFTVMLFLLSLHAKQQTSLDSVYF